jgi:hypothetical protein
MAVKCGVCGKMTAKYHTTSYGDTVCYGTCLVAYRLESYLLNLEERREKDGPLNERAYEQAREMSAYLSLYKYGNTEAKKTAAKAILAWAR